MEGRDGDEEGGGRGEEGRVVGWRSPMMGGVNSMGTPRPSGSIPGRS